jgi:AraC family transcriptional regulator
MEQPLAAESFHGRKVRSYEIDGFRLSEWRYAPGVHLPWHAHECAFVNVMLEGAYIKTDLKRTWTLSPFTLTFHPAGERHADRFYEAAGRTFDLEIEDRWLKRAREYGGVLDGPVQFAGGLPVWLGYRLYDEFRRTDGVSPLAVEGLAIEILAEASRTSDRSSDTRRPRWLEQVRELLHARFTENLALEEIAATVGIHPVHLARTFRAYHRCAIGDYVRQLRVEYACRELFRSDTPLAMIALAAGFADQSHLTRVFKRRTGMTPAQFRATVRPR